MNRQDLLEWTAHYAFEPPAIARIEAATAALATSASRGKGAPGFEVAVNDRDGFEILKLVHVGDNERAPGAGDGAGGAARAAAIGAALAEFDGELAARVSKSLAAVRSRLEVQGLGDWFPTVGFELRVPDGELVEVSFYSHYEPHAVAAAVAAALSLDGPAFKSRDDWFAFGFDIQTGQRPRAKMYVELNSADWPPERLGLHPTLRPRTTLGLRRTAPGTTTLQPEMKAYAHFGNLPSSRLEAGLVEPRLSVLRERLGSRLQGVVIAFVACGTDKVEVYLERERASEP